MDTSFLSTPLSAIKGVGPFYQKQLKALGLVHYFDLLCHRPTHYQAHMMGTIQENHHCCVRVHIDTTVKRGSSWILKGCTDEGQNIDLVFFRPLPFQKKKGDTVWVTGLVTRDKGWYQMAHPRFARPLYSNEHSTVFLPIYPLTKGLTSHILAQWVRTILTQWSQRPSEKHNPFGSWKDALMRIHFPPDKTPCPQALQTMAFDEMVIMHLSHIQSKKGHNATTHPCRPPICQITKDMQQRMGYVLTESQNQAWQDIQKDMAQTVPMTRLLNGDVGSGKTAVAFLAMARAVESGQQACLMAPTETLARQHFDTLCALVPDHDVKLVIGGHTFNHQDDFSFVVGTHALFYDKVSFRQLGLVVVDEQQRFGVMQRLRLSEKGHCPHMLFLSATPIPRTFQRVAYGDMDASTLEKRPCAVKTSSYILSMDKIQDMEKWCAQVMKRNECLYWVCPVIDDQDKGVLKRYAYWNALFPERVGLLHGRLSSQEKADVMHAFRTRKKPFLISTTVIEVGVHVPQATTIFIEDSPRFGLSQLHQLRGRVGRESLPGHCFFLYTAPLLPVEQKRLQYIKNCHDGFDLARYDWQMRGAGTAMGTQQSGHKRMCFFCPDRHGDLIESAQQFAQKLWDDQYDFRSILVLFGHHDTRVLSAG